MTSRKPPPPRPTTDKTGIKRAARRLHEIPTLYRDHNLVIEYAVVGEPKQALEELRDAYVFQGRRRSLSGDLIEIDCGTWRFDEGDDVEGWTGEVFADVHQDFIEAHAGLQHSRYRRLYLRKWTPPKQRKLTKREGAKRKAAAKAREKERQALGKTTIRKELERIAKRMGWAEVPRHRSTFQRSRKKSDTGGDDKMLIWTGGSGGAWNEPGGRISLKRHRACSPAQDLAVLVHEAAHVEHHHRQRRVYGEPNHERPHGPEYWACFGDICRTVYGIELSIDTSHGVYKLAINEQRFAEALMATPRWAKLLAA